ncbi:MAG: metallophosphoesterase [Armatimonadetes bacterium]|nr:hypothetical protein [Armatimonadota bacterium]MBS1700976.1 metallophosphoesterase [Armatimonadota bacterium]
MKWLLSLIMATSVASAFAQNHVRFIITGDDRWAGGKARPGEDENGVNVAAMRRIVKAIVAEKPDVLLFNGDLVGGAKTDEAELSQFETWKQVMMPIYNAGIKVLAARGNHEAGCPHPDDVWHKVFTGKFANPTTGPTGEEGLTYAYTFKNCLFISLDQFGPSGVTGNLDWFDKVIDANHAPHIFVFSHKMAFFSGSHTDGMWTAADKRDHFIDKLVKAGARTVFFGHDHLYDHVEARLPSWPAGQSIHQFVIGTAGAPFYTGKTPPADGDWQLKHVSHIEQKYGYAVVDIDGPKVKLVFKAEKEPGVFETADTLTYTLPKK